MQWVNFMSDKEKLSHGNFMYFKSLYQLMKLKMSALLLRDGVFEFFVEFHISL